eukprot:1211023-Rhodomonas_salina.2
MQVGIPGRVWDSRKMEWHPDVSSLPAHIYLRKQIAIDAQLKGCIGLPFVKEETNKKPLVLVFIFYSNGKLIGGEDVDQVAKSYEAAATEIAGLQSGESLDKIEESDDESATCYEEEDSKEVEVAAQLLKLVCMKTGFPYAEALRPHSSGMALSRARYCRGRPEEEFYKESKPFTFPLMVSSPCPASAIFFHARSHPLAACEPPPRTSRADAAVEPGWDPWAGVAEADGGVALGR